ncbi:MAG: hypothetical protein JW801_09850 [Bacteroidales bacterium]|nr:hypothetical protein [Bacteroidales bacterium]
MKQEMDYSGYVDRYLDGIMSPEEEKWFKKELEGNSFLEQELEFQSKLNQSISQRELIELEDQLNTIYKNTYNPVSRFAKIKRKTVAISAAAVVASLMIYFAASYWINRPEDLALQFSSPLDLYASYYQPAEMSMSFRAAGDVVDSELREAMKLYDRKEYSEAILLFEKILSDDASRIGLNLYSGISHMELEEYTEANTSFRKIIDDRSNAFIESAEWYLGLCYLKTEDVELSKQVFENIASGSSYYKADAERILNLLE